MSEEEAASIEASPNDESWPTSTVAIDAVASDDAALHSVAHLSLAWLSDASIPLLIVDGDLTILWLNACARDELAMRQGLEVRDGILTTTSQPLQEQLLKLSGAAEAESATVCIRGSRSEAHIVIHSRRLDSAHGRQFGVWFRRTGRGFKPVYVGLQDAFKLTSAEQRVMGRLLDGATVPEIAAALRLSAETIRSHVRNIYAKMHVTSRAEMFSLVRAFRV